MLHSAISYWIGLLMVFQALFAVWTYSLCSALSPLCWGTEGVLWTVLHSALLLQLSWKRCQWRKSPQCPTATSGHGVISWFLTGSTCAGLCPDVTLPQRRMDRHKVAVLSGNHRRFSFGIFQSRGAAGAWYLGMARPLGPCVPSVHWSATRPAGKAGGCQDKMPNLPQDVMLSGFTAAGRPAETPPVGQGDCCRMGKQPVLLWTVSSSPEASWWWIFVPSVTLKDTNKSCRGKHLWYGPCTQAPGPRAEHSPHHETHVGSAGRTARLPVPL